MQLLPVEAKATCLKTHLAGGTLSAPRHHAGDTKLNNALPNPPLAAPAMVDVLTSTPLPMVGKVLSLRGLRMLPHQEVGGECTRTRNCR